MNALGLDMRVSIRSFQKSPGLTLAAVATLTLAMGGVTSMFSVVNGVVFRGLPIPDPSLLMSVSTRTSTSGGPGQVGIRDYIEWEKQEHPFENLAAFHHFSVNLAGDGNDPDRLLGAAVTANVFGAVGAIPLMGRVFRQDDNVGGTDPIVILSYRLWESRYLADPEIIGNVTRVNGRPSTIVGVMPEHFRFPFDNDVWVPLRLDVQDLVPVQRTTVWVIGRLDDSVDPGEAERRMQGIVSTTLSNENAPPQSVVVRPYVRDVMPDQLYVAGWIAMVGVVAVLLIASVNVANLMLAHATARRRELAVRTALGASRARIVRQLMLDAVILAVGGSTFGWLAATQLVRVYDTMIASVDKPYWFDVRLDSAALLFTTTMLLTVVLIAGLLPGWRASAGDLAGELKNDNTCTSGVHLSRLNSSLVAGEIVLSAMLAVIAGMTIRSVVNFRAFDLGFTTENRLTARVSLPSGDYPNPEDRRLFFQSLVEQLGAMPTIGAVGLVDRLPSTGASHNTLAVDRVVYESEEDYPRSHRSTISTEYFAAIAARLEAGRDFRAQDHENAQPVAIINRSFADRHFPGESPLGRRIRTGGSDSTFPWRIIVGVVSDIYTGDNVAGGIRGSFAAPDHYYVPLAQTTPQRMSIVLETRGPPLEASSLIQNVVAGLDRDLPVYDVSTMAEVVRTSTLAFGHLSLTFAVFGGIALFMVAVGLHGAIAFSVNRRTRELGIRLALGARRRDIIALVASRATSLVGWGVVAGLFLGWLAAYPLRRALFRVDTSDPTVYGVIAVVFVVVGLAACAAPTARALKVNVHHTLRAE